jgi:hypothetical protein
MLASSQLRGDAGRARNADRQRRFHFDKIFATSCGGRAYNAPRTDRTSAPTSKRSGDAWHAMTGDDPHPELACVGDVGDGNPS